MVNLKGRCFLTLKDYSKEEIEYLVDLAIDLKNKQWTKQLNFVINFITKPNLIIRDNDFQSQF